MALSREQRTVAEIAQALAAGAKPSDLGLTDADMANLADSIAAFSSQATPPSDYTSFPTTSPDAYINSPYGMRFHPVLRRDKLHTGVDMKEPVQGAIGGKPAVSIGPGVVVHAGRAGGYGKQVRVQHPDGSVSSYSHLQSIPASIKKNQEVTAGQQLGKIGSTGLSTGNHLHFEMFDPQGNRVNPNSLVRGLDLMSDVAAGRTIANAVGQYPSPEQYGIMDTPVAPEAPPSPPPVPQPIPMGTPPAMAGIQMGPPTLTPRPVQTARITPPGPMGIAPPGGVFTPPAAPIADRMAAVSSPADVKELDAATQAAAKRAGATPGVSPPVIDLPTRNPPAPMGLGRVGGYLNPGPPALSARQMADRIGAAAPPMAPAAGMMADIPAERAFRTPFPLDDTMPEIAQPLTGPATPLGLARNPFDVERGVPRTRPDAIASPLLSPETNPQMAARPSPRATPIQLGSPATLGSPLASPAASPTADVTRPSIAAPAAAPTGTNVGLIEFGRRLFSGPPTQPEPPAPASPIQVGPPALPTQGFAAAPLSPDDPATFSPFTRPAVPTGPMGPVETARLPNPHPGIIGGVARLPQDRPTPGIAGNIPRAPTPRPAPSIPVMEALGPRFPRARPEEELTVTMGTHSPPPDLVAGPGPLPPEARINNAFADANAPGVIQAPPLPAELRPPTVQPPAAPIQMGGPPVVQPPQPSPGQIVNSYPDDFFAPPGAGSPVPRAAPGIAVGPPTNLLAQPQVNVPDRPIVAPGPRAPLGPRPNVGLRAPGTSPFGSRVMGSIGNALGNPVQRMFGQAPQQGIEMGGRPQPSRFAAMHLRSQVQSGLRPDLAAELAAMEEAERQRREAMLSGGGGFGAGPFGGGISMGGGFSGPAFSGTGVRGSANYESGSSRL